MTFRRKLNIAFVCVGILPLILLGTLMMNRMVEQYTSDRMNDLQSTLRMHVDSLNQMLQENSVAMQTIAASLEVNYYLEYNKRYGDMSNPPDFWTLYDQAYVYLRTLAVMQSRQIKNIIVLPLEDRQGISAYGMENEVPIPKMYRDWPVYQQAIDMDGRYAWSVVSNEEMPNPLPTGVRAGDHYFFLSAVIYGGYDYMPCGVAIIQFNERYFTSLLRTLLENPDMLYVLLSSDDHVLFHSDTRQIGKKLSDEELTRLLASEIRNDNNWVEYGGQERLLSLNDLVIDGWRALALTSRVSMRPEATRYTEPIVLFMLLGAVIAVVISVLFSRSLYAPIRELCETLDGAQTDLSLHVSEGRKDEFGILYRSINGFIRRIHALIEQVKQEHLLKVEADMNVLRSQINPHFLYNTLNIIKCLADMKDFKSIDDTVVSLISLLRASIGDTRELIMVPEEMKLVADYLTIQHLRADFMFVFVSEMQPELNDCKIQKFILQPLVENCLVHAFPSAGHTPDKPYTVLIRGHLGEDNVVIEVVDDGRGLSEQQLGEINRELRSVPTSLAFGRIGLQNVNTRIKMMFGEQYGLEFSPREGGGSVVRISFSIIRSHQTENGRAEE